MEGEINAKIDNLINLRQFASVLNYDPLAGSLVGLQFINKSTVVVSLLKLQ